MKRALISVFDKNGILEFAQFLVKHNVEIISTGGTYRYLKENGVPVIEVAEVTKAPEMLDGRVKTLHPVIHGGILAIRDNEEHMATIKARGIETIDMVVVNLYPFFKKVNEDLTFEEKVEFIDIGGPTMLRSAAKSFKDVVVISDTADYETVMKEMEAGEVTFETRKRLAGKVFNLTSAYDAAISSFLLGDEMPHYLNASYEKVMDLRYGENPHQKAAYYVSTTDSGAMKDFEQLNGKELSFNNIRDMDVAWKVACEFEEPACCGVKHSTPCGAAIGKDIHEAYVKAYECDPVSIFGGIVALNKEVDKATAEELVKIFLEIVIAPSFTEEALEVLRTKKNLRVLKLAKIENSLQPYDMKYLDGKLLIQDKNTTLAEKYETVTTVEPTKKQLADMEFGMKVVKNMKSNAIAIVKDGETLALGCGQTSRIWALKNAIENNQDKNFEGAVLASDAFFPFEDCVTLAHEVGIKAVVQPGGSINDKKSIDACNEFGMTMVCTGIRHFKH